MPRAVGVGTPYREHFPPPTHPAGNCDPLHPIPGSGGPAFPRGGRRPHIRSWRTECLEKEAGSSVRPRGASTLGRTSRGASTTFCSLPCSRVGGVPFPLIPDPSPEMLVRALPSPHPKPIRSSSVRRGDKLCALPLSPTERAPKCECAGGDSGSRPWAGGAFREHQGFPGIHAGCR